MKKSYTKSIFLIMFLLCGFASQAQWNIHQGSKERQSGRVEEPAPSNIEIGHSSIYDPIYEYTGLSLTYDSKVGVGVVLTRDMFEDYIGGIIIGMYVGWDDFASTATYDCFVKTDSFSGESISTGSAEVSFGWNAVDLSQKPLPDVENLYVGFYTNIKKDVISIPYLYPFNQPNTAFLHSGEVDDNGKEIWYDMHTMPEMGKMAVILVVRDRNGQFANIVKMADFRANTINWKEDITNASFRLYNRGSNAIEKFEIESKLGDVVLSDEYVLEEPINPNDYRTVSFPVYCLGTGTHDFTITKVNGVDIKNKPVAQFEMLGVPWDLQDKYNHLPVIEYFVSEEEYAVPRFFDELFWPGFEKYTENYNLVMQHIDDKFMIGDNEALKQLLSMVDNDSMQVYIPSLSVNRSDYIEYLAPLTGYPFHNGTPFPEMAPPMWEKIYKLPTFASVNIAAKYDDSMTNVAIDVTGNIASDVMPAEEPLYLTVYLMEKDVLSYDQVFWDDKDKENHYGEYTHKNVVRDILTPYWGEQLPQNSGDYNLSFSVELDPEWNTANLYVVAFVNRGEENDHMSRQIINSNIGAINWPEAVYGIEEDQNVTITSVDGTVYVNGCASGVEVFNLAGARLNNGGLADGIYLVRKDNIVAKVLVK